MRKCSNCKTYTLKVTCGKCGRTTANANPPRFSMSDKKAVYRRVVLNV